MNKSYHMLAMILLCLLLGTTTLEGAFVNKAPEFGLDITNGPTAWMDYNNDGWVDLYTYNGLWRNNSGTSVTLVWSGGGFAVCGDYDNDGYIDKFDYRSDSPSSPRNLKLYRNTSGTGFSLQSFPALPGLTYAMAACWGDWNADGYVDLYLCGYEDTGYLDRIVMNNGDGSFTLAWTQSGAYPARCSTACDFDEDGDMDIYVSNYRLVPNILWLNNGSASFTNVAAAYGVAGDPGGQYPYGHTIGSAWGDLDNDGHFDLFAGNFSHNWDDGSQDEPKFYRNTGPSGNWHFEDKTSVAGLAWQESYAVPALGDYDNDGDLDLFFTTVYAGDNAVLYRNDGNWHFTDVTSQQGLSGLPSTYQASWGDFDNDGDLDLVTANRLFINQGNSNHWLKVRLKSDTPGVNKFALGTQVRIALDDGRIVSRQVDGGSGSGNQNELTLHFGLGSQTSPVDIEIFWPDGTIQTVNDVAVDQLVTINEIIYKSSDLDKDMYVNLKDFAILAKYWLQCNDPNDENCEPFVP
ncbi:MAG: CRTAC1 family protein [Planctomycetota bacterium]